MTEGGIHNHTNEKELLLQIAEGDEGAFTELFVAYGRLLHPFITQLLKSDGLSEDIIQRIFLKLWLKRDQLTAIDQPRAYIFRMASNECFEFMRKKSTEKKHYAQVEYDSETVHNLTESEITVREIEHLVQEAFLQLPPQQQRIYLLSRRQQLKIPEIAAQLNISPITVKNSLVKSLKAIRSHLEKEGYMPPLIIIGIFF